MADGAHINAKPEMEPRSPKMRMFGLGTPASGNNFDLLPNMVWSFTSFANGLCVFRYWVL
jgi:hypothetical protein